ncbi:MAG: S-methyl-5'-thioadenosine phosphorylase [Candidatus Dadabacteria bacterium]|nr:S-methyl-5'-thioadenosine phosphorylase [Candidatus Dadabacteria bacterium]MYE60629.1 S-methyl-5'-thioadenosine phosphorylase [Candidatus Dadabacteria bacterium]MYI73241.1 S-methyl-5'-thioadenosine phosphorylase [Candidatus Dadabacteria bacterium]
MGGSGLYEMEGLSDVKTVSMETPWGDPSSSLLTGTLGSVQMVFLPRHGTGHTISPSEINFRANIYAMKAMGVERIISVSAVGSLKEEIEPGHIVIPDQFIDNTKRRPSTFFEGGIVAHVSMADPVCSVLSDCLREASLGCGETVHSGGTYVCIEGPQFSTKAESHLYREWGADIIGMTAMPEAKLAREAGICYSVIALCTDYDCWNEDHDDVTVSDIIEIMNKNVEAAKKIVAAVAGTIPDERECPCGGALGHSIITSPDCITEETKNRFGIIYLTNLRQK